jgi:hypothetical protein
VERERCWKAARHPCVAPATGVALCVQGRALTRGVAARANKKKQRESLVLTLVFRFSRALVSLFAPHALPRTPVATQKHQASFKHALSRPCVACLPARRLSPAPRCCFSLPVRPCQQRRPVDAAGCHAARPRAPPRLPAPGRARARLCRMAGAQPDKSEAHHAHAPAHPLCPSSPSGSPSPPNHVQAHLWPGQRRRRRWWRQLHHAHGGRDSEAGRGEGGRRREKERGPHGSGV